MANRTAARLVLRDGDRARLEKLTRSATGAAAGAQGARIVLLAADGEANYVIAERVGVSRPTVNLWRARYDAEGIAGVADEARPGRPRQVDRAAILAATLTPPPPGLGVTHWSSRLLPPRLGVVHSTVAEVWKQYGIRPWKAETFRFSTDPELEAKVVDVVVLYVARLRTRSCCVWTRSARSRRWTGLRRPSRCSPGTPSNAPTTTSATAPQPCSPPWRSLPQR